MSSNPETTRTSVVLQIYDVTHCLPSGEEHVLVFHGSTVDRGALYGTVWRHAEYGEDQIYNVTHWAELPDVE